MLQRLHCLVLASLLAGCSPQRIGTAVGEAIGAPMVAAASAPADAPPFRPLAGAPPDRAVLYVYRPHTTFFNTGGYPYLLVSGQPKLPLKLQGYRSFTLEPGEYEIKAECGWNWYPPTASRTLAVQAGREYYVRVVPAPGAPESESALDPDAQPARLSPFGCRAGRTVIVLVPKEEALKELAGTRLLSE